MTETELVRQTDTSTTAKTKYTIRVIKNVEISREQEVEAFTEKEAREIMQAMIDNDELTIGVDDTLAGTSPSLDTDWCIDGWSATVIDRIEELGKVPVDDH